MSRELTRGTKLNNRYVIESTLGRGGFGVTYKAMDTLVDVPVAIKEYENSSPKDQEMARREVKMAARFYALEGIASARDFFVMDSVSYIVMEYVEGVSLKKHINLYGTMKGPELLHKLKPMIESLCLIHQEGIIHRDISPDNIMVTKRGTLELVDFGEARNFADQKKKSLTLVYKRGYAPIEQCRQQGEQGAYTDIYSLCATIYFAVTGSVPDDAIERLIADHLKPLGEFYGTGLSETEIRAIEKGLEIFPENRFQTMEELYAKLYEETPDSQKEEEGAKGQDNTRRKRFNTAHVFREIDDFYKQKEKQEKKGHRRHFYVAVATVFLVLIFAGILWGSAGKDEKSARVTTPQSTAEPISTPTAEPTPSPKPTYSVERYVGLTKTTAKIKLKTLTKKGLTLRFQERYSKKKKGRVISQSISAGTVLKNVSKKTLVLTISKGEKTVVTPKPTVKPNPTAVPKKKPKSGINFDGDLDTLS